MFPQNQTLYGECVIIVLPLVIIYFCKNVPRRTNVKFVIMRWNQQKTCWLGVNGHKLFGLGLGLDFGLTSLPSNRFKCGLVGSWIILTILKTVVKVSAGLHRSLSIYGKRVMIKYLIKSQLSW